MSNLAERLSLVASKMTLKEAFIAAVYAKLDRIVVTHGTACTNGTWVKFATEFCNDLTDDELFGLSLHEAMHVILMHPWRRDGRRPDVWNIACDAFINVTIRKMGYTLPEGGVDYDWVTTEMGAEGIYAKLMKDNPPPPEGQGEGEGEEGEGEEGEGTGSGGQGEGEEGEGTGSGGQGEGEEGNGESTGGDTGGGGWDSTGDMEDAPADGSEADIEATIMTAAKMAKACGNGGMLADLILEGGLDPKANWADTLRHVMSASARNDYSFGRVNKRFVGAGMYLPALHSEGMGGMVVGVDTSGSMGQEELNQVASEITAICEDCMPEWVEVVYCDTDVRHTERFMQGESIELHAKGGGGTRFEPVFKHIEQLGERIAVLVYFTDMWGSFDMEEPEYPVIWATTYGNHKEAPFGEVVEVTV